MKKLLPIMFMFMYSFTFSQITLTSTVTNVSCFGGSNGTASVTATGGTGPYTYTWMPTNTHSSIITGLAAGQYTINVEDAVANMSSLVVTILEPSILVSAIGSSTNAWCFGSCNGGASVLVNGGTLPYTYSWTNGNTAPTATNLCAGNYGVTITDAKGCITSQSVSISQPTQLNAIVNSNNVKCFGTSTGTVAVAGSGGTSPYSYSWPLLSSTLSVVPNVSVGNYSVIVTDFNGCIITQSVSVTQPPPVTATSTSTNVSCTGVCDGAFNIIASGGAPGAYTFVTSFGPTWPNVTNVCIGTHTITITDANNCMITATVNILSNGSFIPNLSLTTTPYNETCLQTGDGSIDLSITGSNPGPFTYQWSNGAATQDITNLISNLYWVTITDGSSNCLTIMDTVNATGVNCGTILGNVFIDNNSDCIKNGGDNNFQYTSITVNPGNRYAYTNTNGDYSVTNLPYGSYSVSLGNNSGAVFPTCTTTLNTAVSAGTPNSINNNLSVGFNSVTQPDLNVSAWSQGIVPGFVCRVSYYLSNLNNVNASGLFKVTLPSAFIPNITNASPATYTVSGDTLIWAFNNVNYSIGTSFYIDFTTPLSTPLGSTFISCIFAQPTVTDLNYANNTYCYQRTVTGSYDPNDKSVNPVGVGTNGDIAASVTDLTYLIRFQNTGNGPAVNIMVKDTLSANVDINTFEMLGSSHNYNIDVLPGNILRWKFNNIMLADSNSNEPASHGYIQFRIKRTSNNTPGTQIKNTAYIYFDFNDPIVTNTAINTIETVTGIKSHNVADNDWNIYPNPNDGNFTISTSNLTLNKVIIYNVLGKKVQELNGNENKSLQINLHNKGVYFIELTDNAGNARTKKIIVN